MKRIGLTYRSSFGLIVSSAGICAVLAGIPSLALAEGVDVQNGAAELERAVALLDDGTTTSTDGPALDAPSAEGGQTAALGAGAELVAPAAAQGQVIGEASTDPLVSGVEQPVEDPVPDVELGLPPVASDAQGEESDLEGLPADGASGDTLPSDDSASGKEPDDGLAEEGAPTTQVPAADAADEGALLAGEGELERADSVTPEVVIENGTYLIEAAGDLTKVLDVYAGMKENGANVQLYESNMSAAQRWTIKLDEATGYYTISLEGTNKVLDVTYGSTADGTNVQIYDSNLSDAQLWKFVKNGEAYSIVSKLRSDLVLDLFAGGTANGTNVQVWTSNGTQAQLFYLIPFASKVEPGELVDDGAYVLVTGGGQSGSYAVDIAAGSLSDGANAQIYSKNGTSAQRFYLKGDGEGFYTITSLGSGKVLEVANGNLVPMTNVRQWEANGTDAQKWAIHRNSDNSVSFVNKANGLVLDIYAGVFGNGSNLQVYRSNGSSAQKFWLASTSVLTDGIYVINPYGGGDKVIDIADGSSSNGAHAQVYDSNDSLAQRFQVVYDAETNTYRIRTAASGGWLTQDGSYVVQEGSSKTEASGSNTWETVWNGAYFSLKNVASGKVLSLGGGGTSNSSWLEVKAANGSRGQHFLFAAANLIADGLYEIHSALVSGGNLDVAAGSSASGAAIQVYTDNNSAAQKFFINSKNGAYTIRNFSSRKYVDVKDASTAQGALIHQWDLASSTSQLWNAQIADGGGVVFVNVKSGLALAVGSNNAAVQSAVDTSSAAQRWTLEETIGSGWFSEGGTWYYYYSDGSSQAFTNAAYSAYQAIKNWDSKTRYLLCIDNHNFRTVIFEGSAGNWVPVKDWICSVGTTSKYDATFGITARGVFEVLGKGLVMGNDPDYYYWTEFFIPSGSPDGEGQRFHSTGYYRGTGFPGAPYDTTIGAAETHGCVRLLFDCAKWVYDNVPIGSKVYSY